MKRITLHPSRGRISAAKLSRLRVQAISDRSSFVSIARASLKALQETEDLEDANLKDVIRRKSSGCWHNRAVYECRRLALYLTHVEAGISVRRIARACHTTHSHLLPVMREYEERREDPAFNDFCHAVMGSVDR